MFGTRLTIAVLMFTMVNAIVFGVGITTVLSIPALSAHAMVLIPSVIIASVFVSAPISWIIAPRLRARYWRQENLASGI